MIKKKQISCANTCYGAGPPNNTDPGAIVGVTPSSLVWRYVGNCGDKACWSDDRLIIMAMVID